MPAQANTSDQERTIAGLAQMFDMPVDAVAELYERERAELARRARITGFVHIFATRSVLDTLRKQRVGEQAATCDPHDGDRRATVAV